MLDGKARVITCDGEDVTTQYIAGAYRTLEIARNPRFPLPCFRSSARPVAGA